MRLFQRGPVNQCFAVAEMFASAGNSLSRPQTTWKHLAVQPPGNLDTVLGMLQGAVAAPLRRIAKGTELVFPGPERDGVGLKPGRTR